MLLCTDAMICSNNRIAALPFSELHRFPQGCSFKQWMGDDSKALMKVHVDSFQVFERLQLIDGQVYLPAIEGYVPHEILRTFRAFLEFCYIVQWDIITEEMLLELTDALNRFHQYHAIFIELGIRPNGFSLPRHLVHYHTAIQVFGAPNGLCSSITESKHIDAVKNPYQHSNCHKALGQMLLTNQCLDKLEAAYVDFTVRGIENYW